MNVVYIKHFENGNKYVGITNNFKHRMYQHENPEPRCRDYPLYRAMKKYNHYTEIVFESEEYKDVLEMEKIIISNFKDLNIELYNMTNGGEGILGYAHTEETKKKLREINLGKNNPMYGKPTSEETKIKLSKALSGKNNPMYGKKRSNETKIKISDALKGENHPMYGKHHSYETRIKMKMNHYDNSGENNPKAKTKDYYKIHSTRRDKFKRTCERMKWNFNDFEEIFSNEYYISQKNKKEKKYFYNYIGGAFSCLQNQN